MGSRLWITVGWVSITGTAGLAVTSIVQVQDAVNASCIQPLVTSRLGQALCPGAEAEFVHGLIYAVLAGVAFFGGLACFFWAAHLRSLEQVRGHDHLPHADNRIRPAAG